VLILNQAGTGEHGFSGLGEKHRQEYAAGALGEKGTTLPVKRSSLEKMMA